eukprot:gb/GEZN01008128.1/.p1 GENE.gb/GEZN01008128.1/~~gb/GEZN01008128.1/.p1  ORF type:complete len:355 (-),score=45.12 gb/GEZN01008128.1/:399-1376(-)
MCKPKPVDRKEVMVFASEVSTITGDNPYQNVLHVFEKVWQRTRPTQYSTAMDRVNQTLPEPLPENRDVAMQVFLDKTGASGIKSQAVEQASLHHATPQDLLKVFEGVKQHLKDKVEATPKDKAIIEQHIFSSVSAAYGAKQERSTIDLIEEEKGAPVMMNNQKFHARRLRAATNSQYYFVGGRIDGYCNGRLIEIKNRLRIFRDPLPSYDLVQFQTYLFILAITEGLMIERLKKDNTSQVRESKLTFDSDAWDACVEPRVFRFCQFMSDWIGPYTAPAIDKHKDFLAGSDEEKAQIIHPLIEQAKPAKPANPPRFRKDSSPLRYN